MSNSNTQSQRGPLVLGRLAPQPKVVEELENRGWPLIELSRRSGVAPKTIREMYLGERRPGLRVAEAICDALGMEWSDLLSYERPTTKGAN